MKKFQTGLVLILLTFNGCNDTYKLDYDVQIEFDDFTWAKRIEGIAGKYYVVQDELLLDAGYHGPHYKISLANGDILDTLENYGVTDEKEHLILDKERTTYLEGYSEHKIMEIDGFKYEDLVLRAYDRQYRGDHVTFFLTLKASGKGEVILKFNRDEFHFISDVVPYGNDNLIIVYNSESAGSDQRYFDNLGLLDLSELIE